MFGGATACDRKGAFPMKKLMSGIGMVAVLALGAGSISARAESQGTDAARPGSFQAIMATKMPGVYGPHLAQADQPQAGPDNSASKPGSFQSIMSTKSPGVYGPHPETANAQASTVASTSCRPGSFAAVMAAKVPPNARPGNPQLYKDCH
jgi:hypothetical protein